MKAKVTYFDWVVVQYYWHCWTDDWGRRCAAGYLVLWHFGYHSSSVSHQSNPGFQDYLQIDPHSQARSCWSRSATSARASKRTLHWSNHVDHFLPLTTESKVIHLRTGATTTATAVMQWTLGSAGQLRRYLRHERCLSCSSKRVLEMLTAAGHNSSRCHCSQQEQPESCLSRHSSAKSRSEDAYEWSYHVVSHTTLTLCLSCDHSTNCWHLDLSQIHHLLSWRAA